MIYSDAALFVLQNKKVFFEIRLFLCLLTTDKDYIIGLDPGI